MRTNSVPRSAPFPAAFWTLAVFLVSLHGCATGTSAATRVAARPLETDAEILKRQEEELARVRLDRRVEDILGRMTVTQKIGQRFIMWMPDGKLTPEIESAIREGNPAGFILYKWNYDSTASAAALIEGLQSLAGANDPPLDLLICVDEEGGRVAAFRYPSVALLSAPFYWGLHRDPEYIRSAAYILARDIGAIGCNMNLAPVLDLYGKPDSSIIGDRSMGDDASLITLYAEQYVKGTLSAGIIPVAKHFPGHGASVVDSHHSLPVVWKTEQELFERELIPYRAAFDAGCEVVMTAHILYPYIDPDYPVTLSPAIVGGILRGKLGFKGVVMTDSLEMGALSNNFSRAETLRQAFLSGVDLILLNSKYDFRNLAELVRGMIDDGTIPMEKLDEGVRRVLRLKVEHGLAGNQY